MKLAALLMPADEGDGGDDLDLRRHARRSRAERLLEALEKKDADALAEALWPDEPPDDDDEA